MQVTLHFTVKLADQTILDSTRQKKPATLQVGDGNLLPGFEAVIQGLTAGAKEVFKLKPEQGFGMRNPNNEQLVARDQFPENMELKEGLVVSFADASQSELPGVVSGFEGDMVIIDFNHPLAGKDIIFEVEIIKVQPAEKVAAKSR